MQVEDMDLTNCGRVQLDCASALISGIRTLCGDEEYADLTIKVGTRIFKVHKAVLCSRSEFFRVACKKDTFKEGKENVIKLESIDKADDGDDPEIISLLIEFLYCAEYKFTTKLTASDPNDEVPIFPPLLDAGDRTASTHAKVFAAAEKYGIESLKDMACELFEDHVNFYGPPLQDVVDAFTLSTLAPQTESSTCGSVS